MGSEMPNPPPLQDVIYNLAVIMACPCLDGMSFRIRARCIQFFLWWKGKLPSCFAIKSLVRYVRETGEFPTELLDLTRLDEAYREAFNTSNVQSARKNSEGVENLQAIPRVQCSRKGQFCGLCREEITEGASIHRMPCCSKAFHADSEECLGDGKTVRTWLGGNKACMMCKREVSFRATRKIEHPEDGGVETVCAPCQPQT